LAHPVAFGISIFADARRPCLVEKQLNAVSLNMHDAERDAADVAARMLTVPAIGAMLHSLSSFPSSIHALHFIDRVPISA
jgi:hypothetical protein